MKFKIFVLIFFTTLFSMKLYANEIFVSKGIDYGGYEREPSFKIATERAIAKAESVCLGAVKKVGIWQRKPPQTYAYEIIVEADFKCVNICDGIRSPYCWNNCCEY